MSVILLQLVWVILQMLGFAMMFWGMSEPSLGTVLSLGGAALTTEGFLAPNGPVRGPFPHITRHVIQPIAIG